MKSNQMKCSKETAQTANNKWTEEEEIKIKSSRDCCKMLNNDMEEKTKWIVDYLHTYDRWSVVSRRCNCTQCDCKKILLFECTKTAGRGAKTMGLGIKTLMYCL